MSDALDLVLAERVRAACVEAARTGYQEAAMAGLCGEGALEAALSAIDRLDLCAVLADFDDNNEREHSAGLTKRKAES